MPCLEIAGVRNWTRTRRKALTRFFSGSGKCLFLSGFTEEQLNHMHDTVLPAKYKMGFTNMVARATPGSKDLSR